MFNKTGFNPETGDWNDSLSEDFVWSNTNIGDTASDVLTPFPWSIISASFDQMNILPQYPVVGNIGWSYFFPLLGGVITDVGAALSHAAIVALELGIPAVVNCGNATMQLQTGDRVRLDGGRGIVIILDKKDEG